MGKGTFERTQLTEESELKTERAHMKGTFVDRKGGSARDLEWLEDLCDRTGRISRKINQTDTI